MPSPAVRRVLIACISLAACSTDARTSNERPIELPPRTPTPDAGDGGQSPIDAPSTDAAAEAGDQGCAPVRRYSFTSTAAKALGCDANAPAIVIDEPVPARGRAFGRATFDVRLAPANVIHFWNLRVALGASDVSHGLGDDLCPGRTAHRSNVGLGKLTAENGRARLVGHAGAAPCTAGAVEVLAGAKLEVWVEDERPECAGKDIAFGSWYSAKGFSDTHAWTTSMAPLPGAVASLTTEGADEKMRVIGVVEGSPASNPNPTCGAEAATLVLQTTLDKAIMATAQDVVPASQGMGHLVLFTSGDAQEIRSVKPGLHEAALLVGSNFTGTVTTGGCCGDGSIALIRER